MIPEIGHFALILALSLAILQGVFPLWGSLIGKSQWVSIAKPAAYGQLLFMVISFICLLYAFIINDFSVMYVASNSNTQMPTVFRISALWGAHEGSLLLWAMVLSLWGAAVAFFSKGIPPIMLARVLSIMGLIGVGFMLFMIVTSNPFVRLLQIPAEGRQLNPLLQDFGLIIHPPMLYMGYVGMSVAFSFAMAAMISGKLDASWVRWARPWTNIAWVFLTLGIALGSWWAYYELGWGGWWFWDPVENASLMPWIIATALIHSLSVTEKRASFKTWTILLSILGFSLSLLGTFLVRSGVIVSVHSFASDPGRGVFILAFLFVVIGSSLLLFAFRAHKFHSTGKFALLSKETSLLINTVILLAITLTVLTGTLYPLVAKVFGYSVSVGEPWFNYYVVPQAFLLFFVMGFGLFLRWKKDSVGRVLKAVSIPLISSIVIAFALSIMTLSEFSLLNEAHIKVLLGIFVGAWVALSALMWVLTRGSSPFKMSLSSLGGVIAHIGMAVTIIGITFVSMYDTEKDVRLEKGQGYEMAGYTFTFGGVEAYRGPNYTANRSTIRITQGDKFITTVYPEKRDYGRDAMPMTEAGIDAGFTRDLFVALGTQLDDNAWSFRIYHKPLVRWVWLGAILMGFGGLLAALDKRYRRMRKIVLEPIINKDEPAPLKSAGSAA